MWDKILQFNQSEARRIALMAAAENGRRKEENKRALDVQCRLHDKRRQHEEERKDRAKQKAKAEESRKQANELKEDLVRQLAAKEEMKKFEAQEEKLLQKAARKK